MGSSSKQDGGGVRKRRDRSAQANPVGLDECRRCELWRNATQAVGGAGSAGARIMLVGEPPGDQEDRLRASAFRRTVRAGARPGVGRGGAGQVCGIHHERGQAFQVGAARQAAHAQDAGTARNRSVLFLAGTGTSARYAGRRGGAGRHGAQGARWQQPRKSERRAWHTIQARRALDCGDISSLVFAAGAGRGDEGASLQCHGCGAQAGTRAGHAGIVASRVLASRQMEEQALRFSVLVLVGRVVREPMDLAIFDVLAVVTGLVATIVTGRNKLIRDKKNGEPNLSPGIA